MALWGTIVVAPVSQAHAIKAEGKADSFERSVESGLNMSQQNALVIQRKTTEPHQTSYAGEDGASPIAMDKTIFLLIAGPSSLEFPCRR